MDVPVDPQEIPINVDQLIHDSLSPIFNPNNSTEIYDSWTCPFSISSLSTISPELLQRLKTEPCIAGIDEAGRGPVLGPLVYGICVAPIQAEVSTPVVRSTAKTESAGIGKGGISSLLKDSGFKDSKKTTHIERVNLFHHLNGTSEQMPQISDFDASKQKCFNKTFQAAWAVNILSPSFISQNMLSHQPSNLNMLSHASAMTLVKLFLDNGVNLKECYVDTVGTPETYEAMLNSAFPSVSFKVRKKADDLFPMVSAASIAAKVCRDYVIETWRYIEPGWQNKIHWSLGSGYPSHEDTIAFMKKTQHQLFAFPSIVRYSWSTATNALKAQIIKGGWPSDPTSRDTIQLHSIRQKRHRNLKPEYDEDCENNISQGKNIVESTQSTQVVTTDSSQTLNLPLKRKRRVFLSHNSQDTGTFVSPPVDYYLWESCKSI